MPSVEPLEGRLLLAAGPFDGRASFEEQWPRATQGHQAESFPKMARQDGHRAIQEAGRPHDHTTLLHSRSSDRSERRGSFRLPAEPHSFDPNMGFVALQASPSRSIDSAPHLEIDVPSLWSPLANDAALPSVLHSVTNTNDRRDPPSSGLTILVRETPSLSLAPVQVDSILNGTTGDFTVLQTREPTIAVRFNTAPPPASDGHHSIFASLSLFDLFNEDSRTESKPTSQASERGPAEPLADPFDTTIDWHRTTESERREDEELESDRETSDEWNELELQGLLKSPTQDAPSEDVRSQEFVAIPLRPRGIEPVKPRFSAVRGITETMCHTHEATAVEPDMEATVREGMVELRYDADLSMYTEMIGDDRVEYLELDGSVARVQPFAIAKSAEDTVAESDDPSTASLSDLSAGWRIAVSLD